MKKCVLILARGGSKSVPRKNVVDLNGRPLITYAIRAGKESGIDDVWVSTEDSEIEEVSKKELKEILRNLISLGLLAVIK